MQHSHLMGFLLSAQHRRLVLTGFNVHELSPFTEMSVNRGLSDIVRFKRLAERRFSPLRNNAWTVPSGVAVAKFMRSGLASRLPTPNIYEYDYTLDNVQGMYTLMKIVEGTRFCDVRFGSGEREIEFAERQILRHGSTIWNGYSAGWGGAVPCSGTDGDCCLTWTRVHVCRFLRFFVIYSFGVLTDAYS